MARTKKDDPEAKAIGGRLSDAQVRALLAISNKLPYDGRSKGPLLLSGLILLTKRGDARLTAMGKRVVGTMV